MKKAISPLIATVILVALAMSLGAVVIHFTQTSTMELTDTASKRMARDRICSLDMPISILEISDDRYLCYNRSGSQNLEFILENQGSSSASGIRIFLIDSNDETLTKDLELPLGSHNRTKYNTSINQTDRRTAFRLPPTKLIISPIISFSDNSVEICSDNALEVEEFEVCS